MRTQHQAEYVNWFPALTVIAQLVYLPEHNIVFGLLLKLV